MLTKIALRVLPAGLTVLGSLFVLVGGVTLVGPTETEATNVSILKLEESSTPPAEWLRITDGVLFLPEALRSYVEDSKGNEHGTKGYWVPLVSRNTASQWSADLAAQRKPSYRKCRVIVFLPEETMESKFPGVREGQPKNLAPAFVAMGTWSPGNEISQIARDKFAKDTVDFKTDRVILLNEGAEPIQKGDAAGMLVLGTLLALGGGVWWARRRGTKKRSGVPAFFKTQLSATDGH